MSVRFSSPDLLPQLTALYTCRWCGRTEARHGHASGDAPPGWDVLRDGDALEHVCPSCAGDPGRRGDPRGEE